MFVRFRPTAYRLQATLVETRRVAGLAGDITRAAP